MKVKAQSELRYKIIAPVFFLSICVSLSSKDAMQQLYNHLWALIIIVLFLVFLLEMTWNVFFGYYEVLSVEGMLSINERNRIFRFNTKMEIAQIENIQASNGYLVIKMKCQKVENFALNNSEELKAAVEEVISNE